MQVLTVKVSAPALQYCCIITTYPAEGGLLCQINGKLDTLQKFCGSGPIFTEIGFEKSDADPALT